MLSHGTKKNLRKLKQKKYRKESGTSIIEGVKGVAEALRYTAVQKIIVDGEREHDPIFQDVLTLAKTKKVPVEVASVFDLEPLQTTTTFPGILAIFVPQRHQITDLRDGTTIAAFDRIRDPGNLGTIIRTADWFGIHNILLSEESVDPYNEKTIRSAMGSLFRTKIAQSTGFAADISDLKKQGYAIAVLSMEGKDIKDLVLEPKTVYIFGSESHGVTDDIRALADTVWGIPGRGDAESLNVGIAAGIVFSHISSK